MNNKIKEKVTELFYANSYIAINIEDFLEDYKTRTWLDDNFTLTSLKNHKKHYDEIFKTIIDLLKKEQNKKYTNKELDHGKKPND